MSEPKPITTEAEFEESEVIVNEMKFKALLDAIEKLHGNFLHDLTCPMCKVVTMARELKTAGENSEKERGS